MIERIAIVGMAGRFPGSGADLDLFWQNVARGADLSREVPANRWVLPPDRCLDPRIANPDTVYSARGYYLDPFTADLEGLKITSGFVAELDPLFGLVLDVGNRAWRSARMATVDRSRVGLVMGNICLPTDRANDLCREYLGGKLGIDQPSRGTNPLNRFVAGLPAGVLAKSLGLGGGSYTLDAACASSLYAIKLAADELLAFRADAMLAGGASRPDCQYTQMGFAQLRALSASGRCAPFDQSADGLMVGEGAGLFVLKRLTEALRHGDRIHAILGGVGLSNDMHGNLLAPAKEGQLRAMRQAYQKAGWQPADIELIECHATGTPVGDAVEYESLRELWGENGWNAGQCVIGSVKSTVGHLLTGAGAAALTKVLLAIKAEQRPPQANFRSPAEGLRYKNGPFRVLQECDSWNRRGSFEPRRAAVSGFGFGGVNAHLLLEEWVGVPASTKRKFQEKASGVQLVSATTRKTETTEPPRIDNVPIAIVGMAAHVGPWDDLRKFQERALGNADQIRPLPKTHGWSLASGASPAGYFIEELHFPIDRFRIPPKELEETLPQQLVMLQAAAAALEDCRGKPSSTTKDSPEGDAETGVFIGLGLDMNTTNFHLRWSLLAKGARAEQASPPLSANRTMGALGSITASRIARAFHFGGTSFTVCSENASSARAIQLAVRALQSGELRRAVVGGVDLAADPRMLVEPVSGMPSEGATALILKRLEDAERDGDRVYCVIRGVGVASGGLATDTTPSLPAVAKAIRRACQEAGSDPADIDYLDSGAGGATLEAASLAGMMPAGRAVALTVGDSTTDFGHCNAASAAVSTVKAALALYHAILPASPGVGALASSTVTAHCHFHATPRFWLHDRERGSRRALTTASGVDGSCFAFVLEDSPSHLQSLEPERAQPLGARGEALFVAEANTASELRSRLARLSDFRHERSTLGIEALARAWFREGSIAGMPARAVALVARSTEELDEQIAFASSHLKSTPDWSLPDPRQTGADASLRDRVFYSAQPLGRAAKVAFIFPGSGNQFDGMGRDLGTQWPGVLSRQQSENQRLRSQFAPDFFWNDRTAAAPPKDLMFGQVTVGSLVADLLASLGVRANAMIGLSLGESAGLFGLRAWRDRDEMFQRMQRSTLFQTDLAPPYNSARVHWGLPAKENVDWSLGVIAASPDDILASLRPGLKAYLLIVNTPNECVIGGQRSAVSQLAEAVKKPFFPIEGVTIAHCEAARPVEVPYHQLHTLPVTDPGNVTVYSGAWARKYKPSSKLCAESITAGVVATIDIPSVVEAAYRDGVRVFLEVGPGNSCSRIIDLILGSRPHLARAVHAPRQDAVSQVLRTLAHLAADRVPVDLAALYGSATMCVGHREPGGKVPKEIVIPVGMRPFATPTATPVVEPVPIIIESTLQAVAAESRPPAEASEHGTSMQTQTVAQASAVATANFHAHESFLRLHQKLMETTQHVLALQTSLLVQVQNGALLVSPTVRDVPQASASVVPPLDEVPRSLDFEQCCTFAVGKVGDVLGPMFAEVDRYPTRVRLPEGPLQLVDRIVLIEGEPKSMSSGRVVTEHMVREDRWYLDNGRIPTALSVEAGQADLFLSGFLGIDFQTRGLAVYRLLDAVVSFHRSLPRPGETIRYDIAIDSFTQQADAWLFRFRYDGTINGDPFITMRNGVAGFFTAKALAAGKGIVHTTMDRKEMAGKKPADWRDLVPLQEGSLTEDQVEALRQGDLVSAFGIAFATAVLDSPQTLPGGMLKLVDRVPIYDPHGGRFGIGFIRAEYDIKPPEWFIECHFVDDKVMPGTLMYECCLHTLRILLMRLGWVCEAGEAVCEPVPGVNSRLKCRGQVTDATKLVTYEVTIKELGFRPEAFCIADALMYADGKPIVEISNMTLRMSGLTRERLDAIWSPLDVPANVSRREDSPSHVNVVYDQRPALYGPDRILAYSNGNPSDAFGPQYQVFDTDRKIARLPGPPFQFLDRITAVSGEPFVMKGGAACTAQYDVPTDAWYFFENRGERMPFSVLLEVALQPCGWLAAYCGSALTSSTDVRFRNLGGKATQFRPVTPAIGTLTTHVRMTSVSTSAGMIIQHYEMSVKAQGELVYEGTTYFGFFPAGALANQVGIREAKLPWPSGADVARAERGELPHEPPFPAPMMRMVDKIDAHIPDGGSKKLGLVVGRIAVDLSYWFFQAHFYQDPVWPGSLGLESFLQLLKFAAWKRWGDPARAGWQTVALNQAHSWQYRGQVVPTDREVTVLLEIVGVDESRRRLTANGFLTVDGRVIYQMTSFTIE